MADAAAARCALRRSDELAVSTMRRDVAGRPPDEGVAIAADRMLPRPRRDDDDDDGCATVDADIAVASGAAMASLAGSDDGSESCGGLPHHCTARSYEHESESGCANSAFDCGLLARAVCVCVYALSGCESTRVWDSA